MSTKTDLKIPPGPKTRLPLGHLFSFRRDSLGFLKKIARECGDIVQFKIGPIRILLLNHPNYIKEILTTQNRNFVKGRPLEMAKELLGDGLLTSEGELHKRQSRIMQPAFHRDMIESYAAAMVSSAAQIISHWEDGMRVDMKDEMTKMSIMIAGKCFFNADIEKEAPDIMRALDNATSLFGRIQMPFSEWLLKLPVPGTLKFNKARKRLDETIYRIINDRRQSKNDNGDLLSLLLRFQDQNGEGHGMSDQQLRDEAMTLFLTAFDTTSTALTWTCYLLSQNPEIELELYKELEQVLVGRLPVADDIPRLKYTRMILAESLRLYPPSYLIPRQAVDDFVIDNYIVTGGTIILMSPYLIHHDSRFYSNPELFDPRRWEKHPSAQDSKFEFFPFSRGPRACIGEPFAWTQGILALATIAQSWHIKLDPDQRVELLPLINLRPKYGMKMTVHCRN